VADGLADPAVWVLDPCCGNGSYVVAVLDRIRRTLEGRGMGDLAAEELKRAATTRVVGFEIMTVPFVVAHWQVGEMLKAAPLQAGERAAVYLTNALTGWGESAAGPAIPGYEALVEERGAAATVKRERPILVVLGNPPYNAYAGLSPVGEGGLVEPYKVGLQAIWGVKKFNLDELYVRFFRIAERRIAEGVGRGVVSYISNWSWLFLPSFVVMREQLLRASAALGAQLAALLDPEAPMPGVTTGQLRSEIACVAVPSTKPGHDRDWALRGWGNRTAAGVTMPTRGRAASRAYDATEAAAQGRAGLLGANTFDVGLNDHSFWSGVPASVWECRIGGYQVLKKWLSYRDHSIIGRPLTAGEVSHVQQTARRIAACLLLGPALDASYRNCVADPA